MRVFWREDSTINVAVYQYTRHIFGSKESTTCANYALKRTARGNIGQYPVATKAVLEKLYMDDYLDSVESLEMARNRSKGLVHILNPGGWVQAN